MPTIVAELSEAFDSFSIPFQLLVPQCSQFPVLYSLVRARLQKSMKYFSGGTLRASPARLHFAFVLVVKSFDMLMSLDDS